MRLVCWALGEPKRDVRDVGAAGVPFVPSRAPSRRLEIEAEAESLSTSRWRDVLKARLLGRVICLDMWDMRFGAARL
jgi:hypothetical protein